MVNAHHNKLLATDSLLIQVGQVSFHPSVSKFFFDLLCKIAMVEHSKFVVEVLADGVVSVGIDTPNQLD